MILKMSNWTHFVGAIRVRDVETEKISSIAKLFRTCELEDTEDKWRLCNIPRGSEGSLKVQIINSSGKYGLVDEDEYCISIYGSLRNYSRLNEKSTIRWWFRTIDRIKRIASLFVNGVLTIRYDSFDGEPLILTDKNIIRRTN